MYSCVFFSHSFCLFLWFWISVSSLIFQLIGSAFNSFNRCSIFYHAWYIYCLFFEFIYLTFLPQLSLSHDERAHNKIWFFFHQHSRVTEREGIKKTAWLTFNTWIRMNIIKISTSLLKVHLLIPIHCAINALNTHSVFGMLVEKLWHGNRYKHDIRTTESSVSCHCKYIVLLLLLDISFRRQTHNINR